MSSNWATARPGRAHVSLKDPDVVRAADDVGRVANVSDKTVEAARDGFNAQTQVFIGNTAFATGVDGLDKAGIFDATGVKEATTTGIN